MRCATNWPVLRPARRAIDLAPHRGVVMMVGRQWRRQTTSIGKLATGWPTSTSRCCRAGDTFRAAAREQLAVWGQAQWRRSNRQKSGDRRRCVRRGRRARARHRLLIGDTAGRLPTQLHLMDELKAVKRSIGKSLEGRAARGDPGTRRQPTGRTRWRQVKAFDESVGLTGLIITNSTAPPRAACCGHRGASDAAEPLPSTSSASARSWKTCSRSWPSGSRRRWSGPISVLRRSPVKGPAQQRQRTSAIRFGQQSAAEAFGGGSSSALPGRRRAASEAPDGDRDDVHQREVRMAQQHARPGVSASCRAPARVRAAIAMDLAVGAGGFLRP